MTMRSQTRIDRDLRGRIGGLLLFTFVLGYHAWTMQKAWQGLDAPARANSLLIAATFSLFLFSYLVRTRSRSNAKGPGETLFPLFCAGLPFAIYHSTGLVQLMPLPTALSSLARAAAEPANSALFQWNLLSMFLVLGGNLITLVGAVSLRRSFSIMVEAREPVFTGLYAYVRHPLYTGEVIATGGVLACQFSLLNAALFLAFILCQVHRASLEEKKLSALHPSYQRYRKQTRAFLPGSPRPFRS